MLFREMIIRLRRCVLTIFIVLVLFLLAQFAFISSPTLKDRLSNIYHVDNLESPVTIEKDNQVHHADQLQQPDIFHPLPVDPSTWGNALPQSQFIYDRNKLADDGREIRPPNVLGAGAKKCGTIAFATFLAVNPEFRTTKNVEAHYLYKENKWRQGFEKYSDYLPSTFNHEISYEGTPRYLVESVVPEHAKAINASMKVIITLCDPVKRMISDFVHTTKTNEPHGKLMRSYDNIGQYIENWLPHIEQKLLSEGDDYLTDIYYHDIAASVITNGVYAHYLKNWLKYFPRENILFVDGEQTLKRPYEVFEKAQRFLNIKTYLRKEHFVINNSTGFFCVKRPNNIKKIVCLPKYKGRTRNSEDNGYLHISEEHMQLLNRFFRPFNQQLCEIVGSSMGFYRHLC